MEANFRIESIDGNISLYYKEKKEFINDCIGENNFEFSSEQLVRKGIIKIKGKSFKIKNIEIDFNGVLFQGERIIDNQERANKTFIEVIVLVDEL